MVGRLRERQYQLAAQKRNEAYLKQDYYQQTARYFERESRVARQYDSWNVRPVKNFKGEHDKTRKLEQLVIRRNKLRRLLKEEEVVYQNELKELEARNKRKDDASLEALREKLKAQRMERDLYLPRTCRRLRSYFLDPKRPSSTLSSAGSVHSNELSECLYLKDCTNSQRSEENNQADSGKVMSGWKDQQIIHQIRKDNLERDRDVEYRPRNRKYSARYARRSLENTNVRPDISTYDHFCDYKPRRLGKTTMEREENKENQSSDVVDASTSMLQQQQQQQQEEPSLDSDERDSSIRETNDQVEAVKDSSPEISHQEDSYDHVNTAEEQIEQDKQKRHDHRGFESERSFPWMRMDPHVQNLSEKMYLYLMYKELKEKIDDLSRRELHACSRQRWDDALRLRDMKNELELIREKKLLHANDLHMNEELRQKALGNIEKREQELTSRENACMDSTLYSDGAKALWEKWVREDDRFVIKDAIAQRETLMKKLEEEFQKLAVKDKERIASTYRSVFNESHLQNRHRLNAELTPKSKSSSRNSNS